MPTKKTSEPLTPLGVLITRFVPDRHALCQKCGVTLPRLNALCSDCAAFETLTDTEFSIFRYSLRFQSDDDFYEALYPPNPVATPVFKPRIVRRAVRTFIGEYDENGELIIDPIETFNPEPPLKPKAKSFGYVESRMQQLVKQHPDKFGAPIIS